MNTRPFLFTALLSTSLLHAEDGKTYSYRSGRAGVPQQSKQEVEDIGEISESTGGSSKWRMNFATRGQYTSNAALTGNHGSDDFLFLPTFEVGYHTPLGKHFSFDLSTKIESAIFGDRSDRSFIGYSALATLDYTYKEGLPRAYVSVEPYRYDGFDRGELATQAVGFTGGLDWGHGFNAGRSVVFTGSSYWYYLADPSVDSRTSYRAVGGLAHQIRTNLTGQAYYAYQYTDYADFARNDSRHVLAGNLIYQFSEHFFGTMSTTWVNNDSSQAGGSYQSFGAGLGLTLQY